LFLSLIGLHFVLPPLVYRLREWNISRFFGVATRKEMRFILLYWIEIWFISDTQRGLFFVAFCSENRRPDDDSRRHDDDTQNLFGKLTLILLKRRIWWAPSNASKLQMGFNSAFKVLINFCFMYSFQLFVVY
jgi:hypothetical protein